MKNAKVNSIRFMMVAVLAFCSFGISAAQAQDRHVVVDNESSYTRTNFYASTSRRMTAIPFENTALKSK